MTRGVFLGRTYPRKVNYYYHNSFYLQVKNRDGNLFLVMGMVDIIIEPQKLVINKL